MSRSLEKKLMAQTAEHKGLAKKTKGKWKKKIKRIPPEYSLTPKQLHFITSLTSNGGDKHKAAAQAGYIDQHSSPIQTLTNPLALNNIQSILAHHNLAPVNCIANIKELTNSIKYLVINGNLTPVPDNSIRLQANKLALQLSGVQEAKDSVNFNFNSVENDEKLDRINATLQNMNKHLQAYRDSASDAQIVEDL